MQMRMPIPANDAGKWDNPLARLAAEKRAEAIFKAEQAESDLLDVSLLCLPVPASEFREAKGNLKLRKLVERANREIHLNTPWDQVRLYVDRHFWSLWHEAGASDREARGQAMGAILRGDACPVQVGSGSDSVEVVRGLRVACADWESAVRAYLPSVVDDWRFFEATGGKVSLDMLTPWMSVESEICKGFWRRWARGRTVEEIVAVLKGDEAPGVIAASKGERVHDVGRRLMVGDAAVRGAVARVMPWVQKAVTEDSEKITVWGACEEEIATEVWKEWMAEEGALHRLKDTLTDLGRLPPWRVGHSRVTVKVMGGLEVGLEAWSGFVARVVPRVIDGRRG